MHRHCSSHFYDNRYKAIKRFYVQSLRENVKSTPYSGADYVKYMLERFKYDY